MSKRERDVVSTLVWLFAAIAICYGSVGLSLGTFRRPGPGFFSFLAGVVLGGLSLLVFLRSFKQQSEDGKKAFWANPQRGLKMSYAVIALFLYAVAMNYIGFALSTLLFLGFLMRGVDPQRWSVVILWSIFGTVVSYGIFKYWLDVQLPGGIFGF